MSISMNINGAVKDTGCCTGFMNSSAEVVNKSVAWVKTNGKNFAASAGETLKNVWAAVSAFFTMIAQKMGVFFTAAKDAISAGYVKAKDAFNALPKEAKIAGAVGVVASVIATALCCKCFGKKEDTTATSTTIANTAGATNTAPAQQPAQQTATAKS